MSQPKTQFGIHCNECQYEGYPRTNSSNTFLIFFVLLCASVFFLPLIIVALVYMGIAVSKPAKKSCPKCKSFDIVDLERQAVQKQRTQEEGATNAGNNH